MSGIGCWYVIKRENKMLNQRGKIRHDRNRQHEGFQRQRNSKNDGIQRTDDQETITGKAPEGKAPC